MLAIKYNTKLLILQYIYNYMYVWVTISPGRTTKFNNDWKLIKVYHGFTVKYNNCKNTLILIITFIMQFQGKHRLGTRRLVKKS